MKKFSGKKLSKNNLTKKIGAKKMNYKKVYGLTLKQMKTEIQKSTFEPNLKLDFTDYSLSAFDCVTGTKLRKLKNSVCSNCYACKGQYRFSNVQNCYKIRKSIINNSLWKIETYLPILLQHYKKQYFRWNSSGDIQSVEHLQAIVNIALKCPEITFWLPTKEIKFVHKFIKNNKIPSNLIIRISNYFINDNKFWASKSLKNMHFSTVDLDDSKKINKFSIDCPAYKSRKNTDLGRCGGCKACYNSKVKNINYKSH